MSRSEPNKELVNSKCFTRRRAGAESHSFSRLICKCFGKPPGAADQRRRQCFLRTGGHQKYLRLGSVIQIQVKVLEGLVRPAYANSNG